MPARGRALHWEGRIVSYTTESIRNIALAGHAGVGKTTLFEALLLAGGAIQTPGTVERGNTVSDTDSQEKARAIRSTAASRISIATAATST
jgi:elongation factor G